MYYIYIIFAVFISFNLKCQVNMNSDIKNLIDTSISISKEKGINGFKIQIYMGANREEAENIRKKFIKYYPKIKIEYIHESPYYKIRVGKYYSKRRAYRYLKKIKKQFRKIYIVNVKIK